MATVMGWMSLETRVKVIAMRTKGFGFQQILKHLKTEELTVLRTALYKLYCTYSSTNSTLDMKRHLGHRFLTKSTIDSLII